MFDQSRMSCPFEQHSVEGLTSVRENQEVSDE